MSKPITTLDRRTGTGDAIRLMYGQHHRGMLLRLCNNRWGIYSVNDRKLSNRTFLQPAMARDKFDELFPNGVPDQ